MEPGYDAVVPGSGYRRADEHRLTFTPRGREEDYTPGNNRSTMRFRPITGTICPPRSFSIIVAPAAIIAADLRELLRREDLFTCIAGPVPYLLRLAGGAPPAGKTVTVTTFTQMRSVLARATGPLVLIEHDPGFFGDAPGLIERAGAVLHRIARTRGIRVIMLATAMDREIEGLSGYCDRLVIVEQEAGPERFIPPGQATLGL
ncbi:MAG: hypothetical protein ACXQTG_06955 [Methanoculleaceae archaeon]